MLVLCSLLPVRTWTRYKISESLKKNTYVCVHINCTWECLYNRTVVRVKWESVGMVPKVQKIIVFFSFSFLGSVFLAMKWDTYMMFLKPLSPLMSWRLAPSEGRALVSIPVTPAVNTCWCSIFKRRCPWPGKLGSVRPADAQLCCGHWRWCGLESTEPTSPRGGPGLVCWKFWLSRPQCHQHCSVGVKNKGVQCFPSVYIPASFCVCVGVLQLDQDSSRPERENYSGIVCLSAPGRLEWGGMGGEACWGTVSRDRRHFDSLKSRNAWKNFWGDCLEGWLALSKKGFLK